MTKAKSGTSKTTKIGNTRVVGATDADKQAIAAGKASVRADEKSGATTGKREVMKRGDQTPEAKATPKAKAAAADKMFKDADEAQRAGLPVDLTREQHENLVRKAALGF